MSRCRWPNGSSPCVRHRIPGAPWTTVRRLLRYATSFFGIIDLSAILPTLLSLLFPAGTSLAVVRILRLLRIFRG